MSRFLPCYRRSAAAAVVVCATALAPRAWPDVAPTRADDIPRIVIRCGQLIDGVGDKPRSPAALLIEGDRIAAVGGLEIVPAGVPVIDLGGATVLPGLVDAHSHPLIGGDDYQIDHLRLSSAAKALRGLKAVQDNLEAGWTSLRIAGDADVFYAHLDVRRALDGGLFVGPRLCGAGHYISATGGGGDVNFIAPEQRVAADGLIVDGVDEMRRAVREEIKHGSDWIKLLVTGAFMSAGDDPGDVHFSMEEVRAAVEEAGRRRVSVMAHAHAAEGIKIAVRAGVRSIEHGTFMDDDAIDLMQRQGVFLVPTIYIGQHFLKEGSDSPQMAKMIELTRKTQARFETMVGRAIRRGVKIAAGSDFGGYRPELNAREIGALVKAGMTPMQAIQAATRVGADLLGWQDRIGTLEPGKLGDLIAVAGDPLADVGELERVVFVMIGGRVVKRPPHVQVPARSAAPPP